MKKRSFLYLFVALVPFILDRVTKHMILGMCAELPRSINSVLTFDCFFNRGVSWSLFHSAALWQFVMVSVVIALVAGLLSIYAYTQHREGRLIYGELLVLSGAISNLVDRVIYGGVLDFIILSYKGWAWPAFNIADACIVTGIIIMMYRLHAHK